MRRRWCCASLPLPLLSLLLLLLWPGRPLITRVAAVHTLPSLVLNASLVGTSLVQTTFREGGAAAVVTRPGEVQVSGPDAPVTSATVSLTNPLDAPHEVLAVTPATPGVLVKYNPGSGLLSVDASGVVPAASATAAVAATLGTLTYNNTAQAPTGSARVVVCTVTDASGATSAPAVAVVNVQPVNAAPVLILCDPAAYASGLRPNYTAVLYESERTTPVAVASPSMVLTDVDNVIMPKAILTLNDALDGDVEVRGTETPRMKIDGRALPTPCCVHAIQWTNRL